MITPDELLKQGKCFASDPRLRPHGIVAQENNDMATKTFCDLCENETDDDYGYAVTEVFEDSPLLDITLCDSCMEGVSEIPDNTEDDLIQYYSIRSFRDHIIKCLRDHKEANP